MLMKMSWWINQRLHRVVLGPWSSAVSLQQLDSDSRKTRARKHLNPWATYSAHFLWNVSLILTFASKDTALTPEPTSYVQDKSEVCVTKLSVALGNTEADSPLVQRCVYRQSGLWVLALQGCFVICWIETQPHATTTTRPAALWVVAHWMRSAMCCVTLSGVAEAKCFAFLGLQMPESRDWHFPVVLPLGGTTQGCAACWATAVSCSVSWSPSQGWICFPDPIKRQNYSQETLLV